MEKKTTTPQFEIEKYLVASTGHITQDDMEKLDEEADCDSGASLLARVSEYGVCVFVGTEEDMAKKAEKRGFGKGLQNMLTLARKNGCTFLKLDQDGPTIEGHKTYDW